MTYHPILITAGATRNFLDSMRCITANASGKTGAWLASQLPNTTLLGSPSALLHLQLLKGKGQTVEYSSTQDLHDKMKEWVLKHPNCIIVHSAAVGDYEAVPQTGKIPSGQALLQITLRPTIKILDCIQHWSSAARVVSFKAAPPQTSGQALTNIARKQLTRTNSKLVFANVLTQTGRDVQLVSAHSAQSFQERSAALQALLSWIQEAQSAP